jgi:ribosomal protein L37AE/L43A
MRELKSFSVTRDYSFDFIVDLAAAIKDGNEKAENKVGLTVDDYRCPVCHRFFSHCFMGSKKVVKCRHCMVKWAPGSPEFVRVPHRCKLLESSIKNCYSPSPEPALIMIM